MSEIENQPVDRALADLGETPRITATMAAPPEPKPGLLDQAGEAFDPALHGVDRNGNPKMRADGCWWRKPGLGARKAKAAKDGDESYVVPPAGEAAASTSSSPTVDAVAAPEPMLTEADYEGTASGIQNGMFSLMQLWLGGAWAAEAEEAKIWRGALARLWFHYQLPRFGPIIEIIILIPSTIARRRDDARTKEGWAKVMAWMGFKPKVDQVVDQVEKKGNEIA